MHLDVYRKDAERSEAHFVVTRVFLLILCWFSLYLGQELQYLPT